MSDDDKSNNASGFRIVSAPDVKPKGSGATYATFVDLMGHVLMQHSLHREDPSLKEASYGKSIFGCFCHGGRTWEVHARTCYLPLEMALAAAVAGKDPF